MIEPAAIAAAIVFAAIAIFQVALVLGMPWGRIAWGGRYEGVLPAPLRVGSAIAAGVLALAALIVLALAGVLSWSPVPESSLRMAVWILTALMALNTLGNLASESRFEKVVFGPATILLTVLCIIVAVGGNGPS